MAIPHNFSGDNLHFFICILGMQAHSKKPLQDSNLFAKINPTVQNEKGAVKRPHLLSSYLVVSNH